MAFLRILNITERGFARADGRTRRLFRANLKDFLVRCAWGPSSAMRRSWTAAFIRRRWRRTWADVLREKLWYRVAKFTGVIGKSQVIRMRSGSVMPCHFRNVLSPVRQLRNTSSGVSQETVMRVGGTKRSTALPCLKNI